FCGVKRRVPCGLRLRVSWPAATGSSLKSILTTAVRRPRTVSLVIDRSSSPSRRRGPSLVASQECAVLLGRIARSGSVLADAALIALENGDDARAATTAAAIRRSLR